MQCTCGSSCNALLIMVSVCWRAHCPLQPYTVRGPYYHDFVLECVDTRCRTNSMHYQHPVHSYPLQDPQCWRHFQQLLALQAAPLLSCIRCPTVHRGTRQSYLLSSASLPAGVLYPAASSQIHHNQVAMVQAEGQTCSKGDAMSAIHMVCNSSMIIVPNRSAVRSLQL